MQNWCETSNTNLVIKTYRRPYLKLENKRKTVILFCMIVFPQEHNTEKKEKDKRAKYRLFAFKKQEWHKDYTVKVIPNTIRCLGERMERILKEVGDLFENEQKANNIMQNMQSTILTDSEIILRTCRTNLWRGVSTV